MTIEKNKEQGVKKRNQDTSNKNKKGEALSCWAACEKSNTILSDPASLIRENGMSV